MPSEKTKVYLDDLDDRFENRHNFYNELNKDTAINNQNQAEKLKKLNNAYKTTYLEFKAVEAILNALKNEIKEFAGDNNISYQNISVKHVKVEKKNYKAYIEDNNIELPEKYISEQVITKLSFKEDEQKPEKFI